jgi:hypothetical protein
MATQTGLSIVWGIPMDVKPIKYAPEGRQKVRFRSQRPAVLHVLTSDGVRQFRLVDRGDHWAPFAEFGRNLRPQ